MISSSSSLASSPPATSAKVTFGVSPDSSFALDFPKLKARDPPLCICRKRKTQRPMISSHGRTPTMSPTQLLPGPSPWL